MAPVYASRSSRTRTPRARDRRAARRDPPRPSLRRPRTSFWACGPFEQLRSSAVDGEFGFQLSDAMAGRHQLGPLPGRQSRLEPLVDALLAAPAVDRLIADAEVAGDVSDPSACGDKIKNPLPKFPRVTPSSHAVLLIGQQHDIPVIRLHQTQGALTTGQRPILYTNWWSRLGDLNPGPMVYETIALPLS